MSKTYDPDAFENDTPDQQMMPSVGWSNLPAQTKWAAFTLLALKGLVAVAWGASISQVNPMASGVFLADYLPFPLPDAMDDVSVGSLINLVLGLLAVIMPTVIWHHALEEDILSDIRGYFAGDIRRIVIATLLLATYALTITLEVMSLLARVDNSMQAANSPIPTLGEQPELLPLLLVSLTLVLGSCLLGLASAALSRSIKHRFSQI